ncbi:MAG: efflux transporter, family, subunit [Clostridia bacterium]|nr:efflux transporter, family, subunit [Clostridia bacterium]
MNQIKKLLGKLGISIKRLLGLPKLLVKKWWAAVNDRRKRWLALSVIPIALLVAFAGWKLLDLRAIQASGTASEQRTAVVNKGTIAITLSGSGPLSASSRSELTAEVGGKVTENNLEEGKAVKAGDVLLTIESEEAELSLKKMENTVLQKEQVYLNQQDQVSSLNLKAPFSGKVTGISVKAGDNVNSGAVLLTIANESSLLARVQFTNAASESIKGASSIQLHIPEYSSTLSARVEEAVQLGDDVEATLIIENPGALSPGTKVWAEVSTLDGVFTSEQVALEGIEQEVIRAQSSGFVESVHVSENQRVSAGTQLMTITNDNLPLDLENARLLLEEAEYNLEQARLDFEKHQIVAPFDGFIVSVTDIALGDTVKAGTAVAVLIDTNQFSFDINIDELDISQVQKGQEVSVTVEALEETINNPLKGVVSAVALEGTSNNGVTSYPVTITLEGRDGLRSGMNVDGEIQVVEKKNVLMVPLEAVQKRGANYIVWVKREGAPAAQTGSDAAPAQGQGRGQSQLTPEQQQQFANMTQEERQALRQKAAGQGQTQGGGNTAPTSAGSNTYYAGAVQVQVTVGIHNETYMEILNGLNEGDIVVLPQITASSSSAQSMQTQGTGLNSSVRAIGGGVVPSFTGGGIPKDGGQR